MGDRGGRERLCWAEVPVIYDKAVWSVRERRLGSDTGHANGGKVKRFSSAEVEALNRSLREAASVGQPVKGAVAHRPGSATQGGRR
jgi:hypothetical protein